MSDTPNVNECHHCNYETSELTDYTRDYGGYTGPHWLCKLCEGTVSAGRLGASGRVKDDWNTVVADIAYMLNRAMGNDG